MTRSLLVVDDERSQREILERILRDEGYEVRTAGTAREAASIQRRGPCDVVLSDVKMPDTEGVSVLNDLLGAAPNSTVILMTAHGTIDSAVDAMKKGAFDYLTKPLDKDELLITIARAFERVSLLRENRRLRQELDDRVRVGSLIGHHPSMQDIIKVIKKVAPSASTVLIVGESGTGKELIARAIHDESPRRELPFQAINCAAIPDPLMESELFGYEKGAFSGAQTRSIGLFEAAHRGTIFLDEIGDLGLGLQAKILRTLQERTIRRVGGQEEVPIDVRVVAATNKDLEAEITAGRFRLDLFYRLNVVTLRVPPLRERTADIPYLVDAFLHKHEGMDRGAKTISKDALRVLMDYPWPGNVRQLAATIERAVLLCEKDEIQVDDLPPEIRRPPSPLPTPFQLPVGGVSLDQLERSLIEQAMAQSHGVIAKAARLLGLSYKTLQYRLEKLRAADPPT
ncbi:MAG: sigma-54-dependent transcriptional regulator [Nitrospirota bacterium]